MTQRLRIAVLNRNFSATGGGAERYSISLVEQLAARHEVHVFAQQIEHAFPGVRYHTIPMPLARPRWINQLYYAWKTWRATRTGFDVVHSHENTWHGNVHTVHVLPVTYTLFAGKQGFELTLRWLKVLTSPRLLAYLWLEKRRYAWGLNKRVVCASNALCEVMDTTFPASKPMFAVVAPGISDAPGAPNSNEKVKARTQLGIPTQVWLVLFVGNDMVKKGLPTLLDALALLPPSVHLAVVGQGDLTPAMQLQAKGLVQRVYFLGAMQDVTLAYRAADMLVHPTLEDSYGMVVLEAMAHGLPVVVSDTPWCGIAKELQDAHTALLLPNPKNASVVASAVIRLQEDEDLAGRLSANAWEFARSHTWARAAAGYEAMYGEITKRYTQRWLVLAHAFNMDGRAASQTITDKLPHLAAAGVEAVVLSGVSGRKDRHYEHHQLWPIGPAGLRFELRHVLRKHIANQVAYRLVMVILSLPLMPFMVLEKLLWRVESSWSWWVSAYVVGQILARKRSFDLIYSTGGAFAAHVAARKLKRATGIKWLAEVHDPLVMPGTKPQTPQARMQAEVERMICTDADVAIWFTQQALASAKQRHPQLGERGKAMLPGIDAPFKEVPPYVAGPKLVIGHFGSLSATRNLTPIIGALEILALRQPQVQDKIELQITGGPLDPVSAAYLARSPVRDMVKHLGRIEADPETGVSGREQILRRMRSADVLLLLHGTEPICAEYIPSKMYEYLWMQRPILATVHGNTQMAGMLRGQGHSVVETDHASAPEALANEIARLLDTWEKGGLDDNGLTSPYTTRAAVIDGLLGGATR